MATLGVQNIPAYGVGVVAMKPIKAGELIFPLKGAVGEEQTAYTLQFGDNKHLQADPPANYLNHSCDANAFFKIDSRGLPSLYAKRDISRNEQITVDYDTFEYETKVMRDISCQCGSANCRKKIRGWKYLSPQKRIELKPYALEYLLNFGEGLCPSPNPTPLGR